MLKTLFEKICNEEGKYAVIFCAKEEKILHLQFVLNLPMYIFFYEENEPKCL